MKTKVHFSSLKGDWETPELIFQKYNAIFNFQVDLAANNKNNKCDLYIDEGINSLTVDWHRCYEGWCWLNPPYGRQIKHWIKKCHEEALKGCRIVALLPSRTDTKWFHDYIYRKYEVLHLAGRIKFLADGKELDAAPFPSMIVIFRPNL